MWSVNVISCKHIYQEANEVADQFSKEAVSLIDGFLHYEEAMDSLVMDKGKYKAIEFLCFGILDESSFVFGILAYVKYVEVWHCFLFFCS